MLLPRREDSIVADFGLMTDSDFQRRVGRYAQYTASHLLLRALRVYPGSRPMQMELAVMNGHSDHL